MSAWWMLAGMPLGQTVELDPLPPLRDPPALRALPAPNAAPALRATPAATPAAVRETDDECPHCGQRVLPRKPPAPKPVYLLEPAQAMLPPMEFPHGMVPLVAVPREGHDGDKPSGAQVAAAAPATAVPTHAVPTNARPTANLAPAGVPRLALDGRTARPAAASGPQWSAAPANLAPAFGGPAELVAIPASAPAPSPAAPAGLPAASAGPAPRFSADAWVARPAAAPMPAAAGTAVFRGTVQSAGGGAALLRAADGATYRLRAAEGAALPERGVVEIAGALQPPGPREALPTLVARRVTVVTR